MEYTLINKYNIAGQTQHKSIYSALKAKSKREGLGWEVIDSAGNTWDVDFDGQPVISIYNN